MTYLWPLFGGTTDAETAAAKTLEKQNARQEALAALREKLQHPSGIEMAQQLVSGNELRDSSELTSDQYLTRWLRAREYHVEATYKTLAEHAAWRAKVAPHGCIDEASIANELKDKKVFLANGCDRQGRAIGIVQVRKHNMWARDIKEMELFVAYCLDAVVAMCDPDKNPERKVVAFFDLSNTIMANLDIPFARVIFGLLGSHYVERLSVMYFYNPPTIFWGLWHSLKGLLPEVTRKKICVIDPKDLSSLRDNIDSNVLPKQYGGEADLMAIDAAVRSFNLPMYNSSSAQGFLPERLPA